LDRLPAQVVSMAVIESAFGRIGMTENGSGPATPIVFLHGVGSDKSVWAPQLEHFGRTRRAIAFDYPSYGESDLVADATRDDFAAAILAGLDTLGVKRAHICGLSLGGVIAIAMHAAAPERCASLILADTFAVHPEGQAIHDRSVDASRKAGMRAIAEQRVSALLAPATSSEIRSDVIETMAAIDPEAYRLGARAVWLADQRERVTAIDVSTLIIVGTLDSITPPSLSDELASLIGGARVERIEEASHLANLDRPDEFNRLVDEFLSETEEKA
jgi:3-oxoadipate enol-lactonase